MGDASDLNELEDDSFDLVVSIFGAMFAPRPLDWLRSVFFPLASIVAYMVVDRTRAAVA